MMRPAIKAFDDRTGGAFQFVVEPAGNQMAEHRIPPSSSCRAKPDTSGSRSAWAIAPCMILMISPRMERSRDVCSRLGLRGPTHRAELLGDSEPLELGGAVEHKPPEFQIFIRRARAEIGDAGGFVRDIAQSSIKAGPALGLDLLLQGGSDFLLGPRTEL